MKFTRQFWACVSASTLLSLAVASCGPEPMVTPGPVPTAPDATVSPSPSPSASASPSASPEPSVSPSASPSASASPDPSASPPEIVFGPSGTPGPNDVSFTFKARLLSESGAVLPVARTSFKAVPYNLPSLQQELITKNAPGPKPSPPLQSDAKYQTTTKICTSTGCTTESAVDTDAYRADLQTYQTTTLPNWEKSAYAGLDEAIQSASMGKPEVNLVTDANGDASMRLPAGTWYFSGKYAASGTSVSWDAIPFAIGASTQSVQLIR